MHTYFIANSLRSILIIYKAALCLAIYIYIYIYKSRKRKKNEEEETHVHVTRFLFTSLCCLSLLYQALSCVFKAHYHKLF